MRRLYASAIAALLVISTGWVSADSLEWPPEAVPTVNECQNEGPVALRPGNNPKIPVNLILIANVGSVDYRKYRDQTVAKLVTCDERGRGVRSLVTNGWGIARTTLSVTQVLRGPSIARSPLWVFSSVGEWGPGKEAVERLEPVLFCLRFNDGVYWVDAAHLLSRGVDGSQVVREDSLQYTKLRGQGDVVLTIGNDSAVIIRRVDLSVVDPMLVCR